jgi:hypothetical protein
MGIEPRNVTTSNIVETRAMFVCSVVHTLAAHSSACAFCGEVCVSEQTVCGGTYRDRVMWKRSLVLGLAVLVPVAVATALKAGHVDLDDPVSTLVPDLSAITTLLGVDEPTVKKVLASWGPGEVRPPN